MYKYLLDLKGSNKDLAITEFTTLFALYYKEDITLERLQNTVYLFTSKVDLEKDSRVFERVTYTNGVFALLWKGEDLKELENNLELLTPLSDSKSYAVEFRTHKKSDPPYTIVELAEPMWQAMKSPKVDLKSPQEVFTYFFFAEKKEFMLARRLFRNDKEYLRRMPKLRPVVKPYTLKSDLARASVNLLGIDEGVVLDPFCGLGGILLEAVDMNLDVIGNDISWNDLKHMKEIFTHFFPDYEVKRTLADSSTQFLEENTIDGIVTDIPYGKSSRKLGDDLYENFLKSAKVYLKQGARMVIIYANFTQFRDLALKYFNEVREIEEYINKSMTRHILVLENSK